MSSHRTPKGDPSGVTRLAFGFDLVFRLGDTRILWGYFPPSWFIARATGSRSSRMGLVAIEAERSVVYQGVVRDNFGGEADP